MRVDVIEQAPLPGRPSHPDVAFHGDLVVINGACHDLAPLAEGDVIDVPGDPPFRARRDAGELVVTVFGLGDVVPEELAQAPEVTGVIDWATVDDAAHRADRELAERRDAAALTKRQFCLAVMQAGILSPAEASAAARGEWPASLTAVVAGMTEVERAAAEIEWSASDLVQRNHPLLSLLQGHMSLTDAQIDALFGI